ncbi:Hypothetical protein BSSP2_II1403 [Brucella suis bv. 2]|nr:conserved hypothetical protein [Brucella melitensis M28]ADZ89302.1 conserved hypothetical protein [Brucella melitensis M5-90]AIB20076.1 Hypothetical protein BSSP3_II1406 [Brucella suis bv. 2]ERM05853.1 hypothetical protein P408_04655 [Brucella abortus S99]ERM87354.1 hypothetical protein P865_03405 [Brucella abortus 82]EXU84435.1 hypothetical protein AX23_13550 [Brucella melitensis 548]KFJ64656.1 hypothetical protein DK59_2081 [Brucella abortus bv. 4 str. 292]
MIARLARILFFASRAENHFTSRFISHRANATGKPRIAIRPF